MPCYNPTQVVFYKRDDGKKLIKFSKVNTELFVSGKKPVFGNNGAIPCGNCIGCKLDRARDWSIRCLHEASLYKDNCFLTLTYADKYLPKGGTLVRKHVVDFIKRVRERYEDRRIRVFYCGEYGDRLGRPHYHVLLFNFDFPSVRANGKVSERDKVLYRTTAGGSKLYISRSLAELWPYGHSTVGSVTYSSVNYVARYVMKKVTGEKAKEHYKGKVPEFLGCSTNPGLGAGWLEKYGYTDCFAHDEVVLKQGDKIRKYKPPRYYDKYLEKLDKEMYLHNKEERVNSAKDKADDNTYARLKVKEFCVNDRLSKLTRNYEKE